jgi:hypothetical protein
MFYARIIVIVIGSYDNGRTIWMAMDGFQLFVMAQLHHPSFFDNLFLLQGAKYPQQQGRQNGSGFS